MYRYLRGIGWILLPLALHLSAQQHNAWWLVLALGLQLLWQTQPLRTIGLLAGAVALVGLIGATPLRLPLAQLLPVAILTALCLLFATTLLPGRVAMISRFALAMNDPWSERLARYTRRLTLVWTLLFAGLASTSTALALAAPVWLWSLFTNLLSYLLIGALMVIEFRLRRRFVDTVDESFFMFIRRLLEQLPKVISGRYREP